MIRRGFVLLVGLALVAGLALAGTRGPAQAAPSPRAFTMVNVLASGAKVWLPSAVVVRRGEQITLTLDNKLEEAHGFAIDEYGIQVVVPPKSTQKVTFTAKPGVSRFYCQLHPAHVGGQVIVL